MKEGNEIRSQKSDSRSRYRKTIPPEQPDLFYPERKKIAGIACGGSSISELTERDLSFEHRVSIKAYDRRVPPSSKTSSSFNLPKDD
ncbi:hypothetical protein WAI453_006427 [Rhynchosporium graminicola]